MFSARNLLSLAFILVLGAIDGDQSSGFFEIAFAPLRNYWHHHMLSDESLCKVLKADAELQPLDDDYRLCRAKWYRVLCDEKPLPLSLFPTELPCDIPPEVGRPQCPDGSADRLPLFAVNSTVHYLDDGKNCDFDVKSRAICGGKCLVASSGRGRTNCAQPSLGDLTSSKERC